MIRNDSPVPAFDANGSPQYQACVPYVAAFTNSATLPAASAVQIERWRTATPSTVVSVSFS